MILPVYFITIIAFPLPFAKGYVGVLAIIGIISLKIIEKRIV